jgi:DNA-binding NarL/FixJ family response regulator
MLAQPKVLVVQVPESPLATAACTAMLARLARHWVPMVLIAVASYAANNAEAAVRQAGADAYLPGPATTEQIDEMVNNLVPGLTGIGTDQETDALVGTTNAQRVVLAQRGRLKAAR